MVRVIPSVRDGEIQLQIMTRVPFWRHQAFLMALGIALLLHVIPLGLFYIPGIACDPQPNGHRAIHAVADASADIETATVAQLLATERRLRFLAPPRSGPPPLPELVDSSLETTLRPGRDPRLRWLFSGPLVRERVQSVLPTLIEGLPVIDQRLRFTVQVDQQLGRVLWLHRLERSADEHLNLQIERYVRQLRFQPHRDGGVAQGELEVCIYGGLPS